MKDKTLNLILIIAGILILILILAFFFLQVTGSVIKEEKEKPEKIKPKDCYEVNNKTYCKIGTVDVKSGDVILKDGSVK